MQQPKTVQITQLFDEHRTIRNIVTIFVLGFRFFKYLCAKKRFESFLFRKFGALRMCECVHLVLVWNWNCAKTKLEEGLCWHDSGVDDCRCWRQPTQPSTLGADHFATTTTSKIILFGANNKNGSPSEKSNSCESEASILDEHFGWRMFLFTKFHAFNLPHCKLLHETAINNKINEANGEECSMASKILRNFRATWKHFNGQMSLD